MTSQFAIEMLLFNNCKYLFIPRPHGRQNLAFICLVYGIHADICVVRAKIAYLHQRHPDKFCCTCEVQHMRLISSNYFIYHA